MNGQVYSQQQSRLYNSAQTGVCRRTYHQGFIILLSHAKMSSSVFFSFLIVCIVCFNAVEAFTGRSMMGRVNLASKTTQQKPTGSSSRATELYMGGKMSKFGIFSPAVIAAKFILGEAKLNKLRGKAISLHSQAITEWCLQYGAYNLRLKLIKKAKKNGDELGFLI